MKLLSFILVAIIATNTFPSISRANSDRVLVCGDIAKNSVILKFIQDGSGNLSGKLIPRKGYSEGTSFDVQCKPRQDTIENSYSCGAFTSTDSGYSIKLYSRNSSSLFASVTPWTMTGEGKVEELGQCTFYN